MARRSGRGLRLETLEERTVLSIATPTSELGLDAEQALKLTAPSPSGSEFRVNATAQGSQLIPSVAVDDAGRALVVFNGWGASGTGVYGRRFDANGNALDNGLFLMSDSCGTGGSDMAMRGDGRFVVVRTSIFTDGDGHGIEARVFNADGTPRTAGFQVNVTTAGNQEMPAVAMDAAGNFVVVWQGPDGDEDGVYVRLYGPEGNARSDQVRVNSSALLDQDAPDVAMDDAGNFVVVWYNAISNGDSAIVGRLFYSDGTYGNEFFVTQVHHSSWHAVDHPAVARNGAGFVVAWSQVGADGQYFDVNARRFDSGGGALSPAWQVNSYTTNSQREPGIGINDRGDFMVAWQSHGQDASSWESWGAYARSYDAIGQATSDEFLVATTTESDQTHPVVAMDNTQIWVAWESLLGPGENDGGILGQRFAVPASSLGQEDVVLDFGTSGTWLWKNGGTWQFLHSGNPAVMAAGDFDGNGQDDVAISYGAGGVWIRYSDGRWEFLHSASATTMSAGDMNADGRDELVIGFASGGGTWQYTPATRAWRYLHRLAPTAMACGDVDGTGRADVAMAFAPGQGTWLWKNESAWQFLHNQSAASLLAAELNGDTNSELVVSFAAPHGVWSWANGGLWTSIHSSTPNALASGDVSQDGREELFMSFGASGLWEYNPATRAWKFLHGSAAVSLAAGDVDGSGRADLVVGFSGNAGSWVWKDDSAWTYLHAGTPEAMLPLQVDGVKASAGSAASTAKTDSDFRFALAHDLAVRQLETSEESRSDAEPFAALCGNPGLGASTPSR